MEEKISVRKIDTNTYMKAVREMLQEGNEVPLTITGNSMSPFMIHERDKILISSVNRPLKKGDMAFYQRVTGQYVMHRIRYIRQGERGEAYYFIGDAQNVTEGPIYREQIFGLITSVCRKGKWIKPGDFWWEFFEKIWIRMVPLRKPIEKIYGTLRRLRMLLLAVFVLSAGILSGCDSTEVKETPGISVNSDEEGKEGQSGELQEQNSDEEKSQEFLSADRSIALTLPEGWFVTHDQRILCSFASEEGAVMDITYTEGKARMVSVEFPMTEKEAESALEGPEEEGKKDSGFSDREVCDFESEVFENSREEDIEFYRYYVKSSQKDRKWQFYAGVRQAERAYQVVVSFKSGEKSERIQVEEALQTLEFLEQEALTEAFGAGMRHEGSLRGTKRKADDGVEKEELTCIGDVNVRTEPNSDNSQVIGTITEGETIEVIKTEGNWYQIRFEGQTAYVYKNYFE